MHISGNNIHLVGPMEMHAYDGGENGNETSIESISEKHGSDKILSSTSIFVH